MIVLPKIYQKYIRRSDRAIDIVLPPNKTNHQNSILTFNSFTLPFNLVALVHKSSFSPRCPVADNISLTNDAMRKAASPKARVSEARGL